MRILFFTANPVLCQSTGQGYYGAGWVGAFLRAMRHFAPELELGVVFEYRQYGEISFGEKREGITLYPLRVFSNRWAILKKNLHFKQESALLLPEIQHAVQDFKPDVIHIFGSENPVGVICGHTNIPCAIHIQGFLPSYENAKYPPGINANDALPCLWRHPWWHYWHKHLNHVYHQRAEREKNFLTKCNLVMGRTHWDQAISRLYAPQAQYHYVSEVLREQFYSHAATWKIRNHEQEEAFTIITVTSLPMFKGHDLILKTVKLLIEHTKLNFVWKIYGLPWNLNGMARRLGLRENDKHVQYCGIVTPDELVTVLLASDLFVLPSYIENSPNSLCEAQLLGLPCVATNVGGVASLIADCQNGLLVPANDPVMMADAILNILSTPQLAIGLGKQAATTAQLRHCQETIVKDALECYQLLIDS